MQHISCDVLIIGAGFAGSLLATIARRIGLEVVLIERDQHPRFAIGESSTPLANLKLAALAEKYDLDWLKPLTKYGSWKREYPQITCGLKRGFSFFHHRRGQPFELGHNHINELMVAANPSDELGDTHWFRADFDAHLADRAVEAGALLFDRFATTTIEHANRWTIQGRRDDEQISIDAAFVVDATGGACPLAEVLGLQRKIDHVRTNSRVLYGHFTDVAKWKDMLSRQGISCAHHPFSSDASALHHVLDVGWMWVLNFDNGITSAGFSLAPSDRDVDLNLTPEQEWDALMAAYPSIQSQFRDARAVRPLFRNQRAQRCTSQAAGPDWAMLPHAVGFVDPWLSPGIAYTLFGVERLARIFADKWASSTRVKLLENYNEATLLEFDLIDKLDSTCLSRFDYFPVLCTTTMLYFVAAIYSEERIRRGLDQPGDTFLLSHDPKFRGIVDEVCTAACQVDAGSAEDFARFVRDKLKPYDVVDLCDPAAKNMHPYLEIDSARLPLLSS